MATATGPAALPASVWAATAHAAPLLPRLEREVRTEVAIIGAGFTGLATAHHLRKAGIASVVLEGSEAGWGASGRNGGMAVPRYKKGFAALAARYGTPTTLRLHAMIHEAIDTLEATVSEYRIDCGFSRVGHITAAHSRGALSALEADLRWLEREAKDDVPQLLDRMAAQEAMGTDAYVGGYLDPRGAGIHPLNYARDLAAGLSRAGVPIYAGSPVTKLTGGGTFAVATPRGRVLARHVVFATNAYSDLAPPVKALHRRVVPVNTSVIATPPLSASVASHVLPSRRLVSDTKQLMNYFRMLPDNRLLFGGRGTITGAQSEAIFRGLQAQLGATFPILGKPEVAQTWSGKVAVTLDDFPHLGRLDGNLWYALGYGGRGVALTTLLGKLLAQLIVGRAIDAGPMTANRFRPIPFHQFRIPVMQLVAAWYKLRDGWAR
ncbi:MAG TPA: FAD-binding oxidoreductase [Alphaproteobacteria bacterium]|nr:FAD-binding oxidoreductase [Alphaproteobacteria bacterium]